MRKSDKRIVASIAVCCFLMVCCVMARATETRVESMGGIGLHIKDNSNIFFFPATITNYPKIAIAELRQKDISQNVYTLGAHIPVASNGVLGLYLNNPNPLEDDVVTELTEVVTNNVANGVYRTTTLLYGMDMEGMKIGAKLSYASDKEETENKVSNSEDNKNVRFIGLCGGVSSDIYDVGVQFDYLSSKHTTKNTIETTDELNGFRLKLLGRTFMEMGEEATLVPLIHFEYGSASRDDKRNTATYKENTKDFSLLDLDLAGSINYSFNENNLLVLGLNLLGITNWKVETNREETTRLDKTIETTNEMELPKIFIGVESKIKKWLLGRLGASQRFIKTTMKTENITEAPVGSQLSKTETETKSSDTEFDLSFGFAIKSGNFTLDACFNEFLLFDGPNFISGSNNNINKKISLTYAF